MNWLFLALALQAGSTFKTQSYECYRNGVGCYSHTFMVDPQVRNIGGSTTTAVLRGSATYALNMNATTDDVYFEFSVENDWDAASDVKVSIHYMLSTAETANDTLDSQLICEWSGHNEVHPHGTQTLTDASNSIGAYNAQYSVHDADFVIDYDAVSPNMIEANDHVFCKFNMTAVTSVAEIDVLEVEIYYRSKYPRLETGGVWPPNDD